MIDAALCSEIADWVFAIGLTLGILIGIASSGLSLTIYVLTRHVIQKKKYPILG